MGVEIHTNEAPFVKNSSVTDFESNDIVEMYLDCDEGTLIIFNQGTKESDKESSVSRDEPWRPGLSTALEGSEFI